MLNRYHILHCFLLLHFISFSQFQVKNFFSITGKKDVPVNIITQDHDGFLWLGTNDGLYKFDGKVARHLTESFPTLKKEISAIFIDPEDKAWIGCKTGQVYTIYHNKIDSLDFTSTKNESKITSFTLLNSKLIISTYGSGVFIYENKQLQQLNSSKGLSDDLIYKSISDKQSKIWCASDAGISEIDFSKQEPSITLISDKNGLPDNIVRDLFLKENKLYISMQDSGLSIFNLKNRKFERNLFFNEWSKGVVLNTAVLKPNKIIIATEKNGLYYIHNSLLTAIDYESQIFSSSISQLFIDREQQIWLASKKGISQIIEKRYHFINNETGLQNDKILALAIDNNQAIWLGSTDGVYKLTKNENGKTQVQTIQDLKKYTVSCATKAPDGNIWFGTYGQGIIVLSVETGKSVIINARDDEIANNNISQIYFEDEHHVYISTLGGGLISAILETNGEYKLFNIEKTYNGSNGLGSNYVYASITGNHSELFVATDGEGLLKLDNNNFVNLTKKFNINSNTIFSLCKDDLGQVWAISNEDGILKYDGKSITKLNLKSGLREIQPQQIVYADGHIYSIHAKGIDKINCKNNHVSYFDLNVDELEPNLNAVIFANNNIYSGTNSGLLVLRTKGEYSDSIQPKIYLNELTLNYKSFPRDSTNEFRYNQNNFGFNFNGIWLKNPDHLIFRYQLKGIESNWNYCSDGKLVNYNNLEPGNYTFIAQVQNEEEIWSEPIGYSFIILSPIWKRWWFWLILLSGISFSIYTYLKYRLKALQKENLILELKVQERTAQIEKQSKIIEAKNIELEQLSLVASKTDNVVLILDQEGNLEFVNESFIRLHQLSMDELIKKYGRSIFELSNHPNIKEIVEEAVSQKKSINYESLNKKVASENAVWQSSTLTPIFNNQGALRKIIIIDTDVSDRKKQEQIIFQKNKDITDSISYARKIQYSILPQESLIKTYLPESFLVYLTKDIVSGDFYWFTHIEGATIIAAVDCTGHGVPGAFMSLIGYNLLNKIVNEDRITDPKLILQALNQGVIEALYKNEAESKDGMDIAICKINHEKGTLEFGAAMRPLWLIENNEIREVKGDKIPIGTKQKDRAEKIEYTTHEFTLNNNTHFYIFTDGYADQFGGPKEKKYSSAKFKDLLLRHHHENCSIQGELIIAEHIAWKSKNEQVDDILVIGFKA